MHAIDGMACAKRGCATRGKLGLNIVGHGSVPTKWGVGALIQRGGRAVAGMLTIATAGGS